MKTPKHPDADRIQELGGPAAVAKLLRFDVSKGGVQRVQNWMARGIPSKVKVDHAELFLERPKSKRAA